MKELGAAMTLSFEPRYIMIELSVNTAEVIPAYMLTQTSAGKLSKKEFPLSKFNELCQDYVCSCVLRIAREIYAYIPVEFVFINAVTMNTTILSVAITPATLRNIRFDTADAADSMRHFTHHMKFSKSGGLEKVDRIDPHTIMEG